MGWGKREGGGRVGWEGRGRDGAWVGGEGEGEQASTEAATGPPSAGVSPGCTRRVTPASAGGDVRECIVGSTCPLAGWPDASPLSLFPHPVHGVDRLPLARVGSPGLMARPSPSLSSLGGQGGQGEGGPQCEHRISPCLQGRGMQGRTRTDPCGAHTVVSPLTPVLRLVGWHAALA